MCLGGQNVYGNSVLAIQVCCEPKTALKSKVYLRERERRYCRLTLKKEKSGSKNKPWHRK